MSKKGLVDRLNGGPVICAEGFLFEIEKRGYLSSGQFVPMVSLEHPEALEIYIEIFNMLDPMSLKLLPIMVIEKK